MPLLPVVVAVAVVVVVVVIAVVIVVLVVRRKNGSAGAKKTEQNMAAKVEQRKVHKNEESTIQFLAQKGSEHRNEKSVMFTFCFF